MKILLLLPNDSLGGAEQCLKMIAGYYRNENVDVFFLKKRTTNHWLDISGNTSLNYINASSEHLGFCYFLFRAFFTKRKRYDYIFTSHVLVTGLAGFLVRIGRIKKKKFIARESTMIFQRYRGRKVLKYKLMYRIGYPATDLIICQTDLMKAKLLEALPQINQGNKVHVIHNPINLEFADEKAADISDKNEIEQYGQYIVSAGRLISDKGYDILIEAFSKIKHKNRDLKLVILGEGDERCSLLEQIRSLELEGSVFLPGYKENVYPYFKYAQLCAVSSRLEGFPNVLLQMMSQNGNVISTRCAGGVEDIPGLPVCDTNRTDELVKLLNENLVISQADKELRFEKFRVYLEQNSLEGFITKIESKL